MNGSTFTQCFEFKYVALEFILVSNIIIKYDVMIKFYIQVVIVHLME